MIHTTFRLARGQMACMASLLTMQRTLGPDWGEDDLIPLTTICKELGVLDGIWALRATVEDRGRVMNSVGALCVDMIPDVLDALPVVIREEAERYTVSRNYYGLASMNVPVYAQGLIASLRHAVIGRWVPDFVWSFFWNLTNETRGIDPTTRVIQWMEGYVDVDGQVGESAATILR